MPGSRRKESGLIDELFELFLTVPWWIGPLVAAIAFVAFRWVIPLVFALATGSNELSGSLMGTLSMFAVKGAPLVCGLVLLIWVGAEVQKLVRGRRFERLSGSGDIRDLDWREFEALLSEAFRRQGFTVEHTGTSGPDGGIDLRLTKAGAVTLVQCKHWKKWQVGVSVVRELLGVVSSEGAQAAIVVTSGQFTSAAKEFANRNPIRLIDGRELVAMIGGVQKSGRIVGAGVSPAMAATPPAAVTSNAAEIKCPTCGAAMVRRVAKRGPNAGGSFLGCSRYPECRGTLRVP